MRITSTRQHAALALACALALGLLSTAANAQDANEKALLVNTQGGPIMTGAGECWHMAFGPAPACTLPAIRCAPCSTSRR